MSREFEPSRLAVVEAPYDREPPIAATIERVTARLGDLGMRFGEISDGWQRTADVLSNPDAVRDLLDQICAIYQTEDRQVAASFLVLGYFWYPMAASVACYLLERRVPNLAADSLAMRLHSGVTFLSPDCWALPDDPDADRPEVRVVANLNDLRRCLIEQLQVEHAAPLFATLRLVAPYGIPAMRANYIDRLASAVVWIAQLLGDEDLARHEVPAMVALINPKSRTGLTEIEHEGRKYLFLRRGGCCLSYRLPGSEMCDTCRLHPAAEREALLRAYLTTAPPTA